MSQLPLWAVGRNITAYGITAQSMNTSTGVLADATPTSTYAVSVYGHLQECEVEQNVTLENISPMDSLYENNVPIEFGTTYRVTEIEKSAGVNKLAMLANSGYNYFKVVLTRGAQTWTGYAVISNYRMTAQKNKVLGSFEMRPVNILDVTSGVTSSSANPLYS